MSSVGAPSRQGSASSTWARIHHEILLDVLNDTRPEEFADLAAAASEFFVEVLATYDMTQRGLLERG